MRSGHTEERRGGRSSAPASGGGSSRRSGAAEIRAGALFALLLGLGVSGAARAQTCTVPGSHATIQAAVDDPACATITLAGQTYAESVLVARSLTLAGPGAGGAVIRGLVQALGSGTQATLRDLRVENGCPGRALEAVGGAELVGERLEVESSAALPCPVSILFRDGFESGDTSAWSSTVP